MAARQKKNKQAEAKGLAGAGVAGGGCTLCARGGLARGWPWPVLGGIVEDGGRGWWVEAGG